MMFDNVRTETMNRGDMNAMMAACQLGRDRFLRLVERYGAETVMSAAYGWMDYSEKMLRERDREDPRRRVQGADRAGSTTTPATAAVRLRVETKVIVEGDEHHDRPDRLRSRGPDRLQRPVRGLAAGRRLLRGAHAAARRGHVPRARAPERRGVPPGEGDRAEGDDLQPEVPAGVLLALLPGAAGGRQHDPGAGRPAPAAGDRRQLGRDPLLLLLGLPARERASTGCTSRSTRARTAAATARTRWTPSTT